MGKWFRTRISEARQRSGLSQVELGEKLGVSQMTIWNWENGKSSPREEQYGKVVEWIESLEGGEEPSESDVDTGNNPDLPASIVQPEDESLLLGLVPKDGSVVTNLSLIKKLESKGWQEEKYWLVRDRLLDTGVLLRGRGRGGSVRRRDSETAEPGVSAKSFQPASEASLYQPLLRVLQAEWARDMRIEPHQIHFEETAKQGKKQTGGTWTRPDITAVSVRSFPHLPNKYLDIWTFEVKPLEYVDVTGVFEAAAHAGRATRSYALFQVPEKLGDRTNDVLTRCEREATRLRVGLITFVEPTKFSTWETVVEAPRIDTDPELLEQFISTLSEAARRRLSEWK